MTTPDSVARGCECGGLRPPGAKSTLFIAIPRVFSPGNEETFAWVTIDPKTLDVFPSFMNPLKKKSSEVTSETGLHGKPLTDIVAFRSATQKSCNGSGSAEREDKGRSSNTARENSRWKGELDELVMAARDCVFKTTGFFFFYEDLGFQYVCLYVSIYRYHVVVKSYQSLLFRSLFFSFFFHKQPEIQTSYKYSVG